MTVDAFSNLTAACPRPSTGLSRRASPPPRAGVGALVVGAGGLVRDSRALPVTSMTVDGLMVLVAACSFSRRDGVHDLVRTSVVGAGTWGIGGGLYVIIRVARGESFDASRFGPQWSQAIGLSAVHALLLGLPTGIAVAALMQAYRWRRDQTDLIDAAPVADGA